MTAFNLDGRNCQVSTSLLVLSGRMLISLIGHFFGSLVFVFECDDGTHLVLIERIKEQVKQRKFAILVPVVASTTFIL